MSNRKLIRRKFDPETNEPIDHWWKESDVALDLYAEKKIVGDLQHILLAVIKNATWNARPKRNWVHLKLRDITEKYGFCRQAVMDALEDLEKRGLIESKKHKARVKVFRMTQCDNVLTHVPQKQKVIEKTVTTEGPLNRLVLLPGHQSTITLQRIGPNGEVENILLTWHNDFDRRLAISVELIDGRIVAKTLSEQPKNGVETPSPLDQLSAFSSPSNIENKEDGNSVVALPEKPQKTPPTTPPDTVKRYRLRNDYRAFLTELRWDAWGESLDDKYLDRAVRAADGMPVDALEQRLIRRFGANYKAGLTKHRPGLLFAIVEDAAVDYKARQRAERQRPEGAPPMTDEQFRLWVNSLPADDYAELVRRDPTLAINGLEGLIALNRSLEENQ